MIQSNDLYEKEAWINNFKKELIAINGNKKGKKAFQDFESIIDYLMLAPVERAVIDIKGIQQAINNQLAVQFEPFEPTDPYIYLNIYSLDSAVDLSDSLAILQSMGLKVFIEKPKSLLLNEQCIWIHRYQAKPEQNIQINLTKNLANYFEELYIKCWRNHYAIDTFNQLLFCNNLNAQEIQLFRAYAAYAKQIQVTYSAQYFAETLLENPKPTALLVQLFNRRFELDSDSSETEYLESEFNKQLNDVASLDHDTILKVLFELIMATVRTNYFQDKPNEHEVMSFKLESNLIQDIPKPTPEFEIYVYCKRFEGIHLRGGKVARGGLRWSNRQEDFRTEILGLMKAQMVKNAVIAPTGSKGGFICKLLNKVQTRDQQMQEVEQCYRLYIDSLLNITDNLVHTKVIHPEQTKILDGEDPYLVVAADKGTSTYSDVANEIAQRHQFWLDDAFASGGSVGYDHKKMGITARGAWESVKRHFRVLGINSQTEEFTVIGIGDMSGDVFGNGMLLSKKIKLVAAFNHLQIFIDPTPDAEKTFKERQRLFKLPSSNWSDFNAELISHGGGVFNRSSKQIVLTPEIQQLLNITEDKLSPNAVIRAILKSKADLLWNGGIGTYIKSEAETQLDAQDKANDNLRVNANELNVKMIAEGGNLGATQAARIEFSLLGGDIYTDAIDNSAGVDCSDHEVNIKILLQHVMLDKKLNSHQRNDLLVSMTDEVAELTLINNFRQTQIIDMIFSQSAQQSYEDSRFISHLEEAGILSRKLEQLPTDSELKERLSNQKQGLTKPEISVLLSYSKLIFKRALIEADNFDNNCFDQILIEYFPKPLQQQYKEYILNHTLKKNIMATMVSNQLINQLGIGFGYKMKEETGANIAQIVKAYLSVIQIFNFNEIWQDIENIKSINEALKTQCLLSMTSVLQRSISWILRTYPNHFEIDQFVERFSSPVSELKECLSCVLSGEPLDDFNQYTELLSKNEIPQDVTQKFLPAIFLSASFDITEISLSLNNNVNDTARLFYAVSDKLDLEWIKNHISNLSKGNHWHQLAISSMRNEVHRHHKKITYVLLKNTKSTNHQHQALDQWEGLNQFAINRYQSKITELKTIRELDYAMLVVAVNEVRILLQQLSAEEHY
ncbi:MAG: NAD-glutamate dehydrogenase [Gammaproteobacteria bacterium]|nr:NAD-glutamate dehydrogenase [Gammaproteobacteria bacterium]